MIKKKHNNQDPAIRVSVITIIINTVLSLLKLIAGLVANSGAMVSDAVHSASDVLSTFVVIAGLKLSNKKPDKEHPYGHERMECVAAIILAMMLAMVGFGIGVSGITKIVTGDYKHIQIPGMLALIAAVVSIVVKEWMYWYTRAVAKKVNSGALMADAWHHRSDALSSVGSFAGILFARVGFPIMEPVASTIISLCIIKAAFDIFKDGLNKMVDHSCNSETEKKIYDITASIDGVLGIDMLKTRLFGAKIYIDIEISTDRNLKLHEAHNIAQNVHDEIEKAFPNCKHCMVHVNPMEDIDITKADSK